MLPAIRPATSAAPSTHRSHSPSPECSTDEHADRARRLVRKLFNDHIATRPVLVPGNQPRRLGELAAVRLIGPIEGPAQLGAALARIADQYPPGCRRALASAAYECLRWQALSPAPRDRRAVKAAAITIERVLAGEPVAALLARPSEHGVYVRTLLELIRLLGVAAHRLATFEDCYAIARDFDLARYGTASEIHVAHISELSEFLLGPQARRVEPAPISGFSEYNAAWLLKVRACMGVAWRFTRAGWPYADIRTRFGTVYILSHDDVEITSLWRGPPGPLP